MAVSRWLIAYDIADDLRRVRVASVLLERGLRLQQSVYEVDGTGMPALQAELEGLIDADEDAILAVPTCGSCGDRQWFAGQSGPRLADRWWIA